MATTDKLIIDTPEQVHLEFTVAGIGSRFMALLIDSLLQLGIFVVLMIITLFAFQFSFEKFAKSYSGWVAAVFTLAYFCIYWGYFATFEVLWKGQTPGKRVAGIRVIKDSGRPLNVFEAITRNVLRAVDGIPLYGFGVLTMLLNSRNRRLGDFVAGSLVVHESSAREAELFFNTPVQSGSAFHQAAGLTLQEVELMETFLARRLDIPPEVRRVNAARIAHMIATRLGIPSEARPEDNENFLEIMVREFRNRATFRSN
ncbi:MAG TPA: RDD family protein [Candidatus Angelobacter sp.]|nr:RDD family protein [Candidatus Angelobacter sp.]